MNVHNYNIYIIFTIALSNLKKKISYDSFYTFPSVFQKNFERLLFSLMIYAVMQNYVTNDGNICLFCNAITTNPLYFVN